MNVILAKSFRVFYPFIILLFVSLYSHGQNNMAAFLDSLNQQKATYFETKIGVSQKVKAILQQIDTSKTTLEQIDFVLEYASIEYNQGEAYPYLVWANKVIKEFKDQTRQVQLLTALGTAIHVKQPLRSLAYYEQALEIYEQGKNTDGTIKLNRRIGLSYYEQKKYAKAIGYFLKNVDLATKTNKKEQLVTSYHNIGDTFMQVFDYENAIKYLELSTQLEKDHPNTQVQTMNLSFIGKIYLDRNKLLLSKAYLEQGERVIKNTGELPYLHVDNSMYLGIIDEKNGNLEQAYLKYKKAFTQAYPRKLSNQITLLLSVRMANVLMRNKQYTDAITLLTSVYTIKFNGSLKGVRNLADKDIIEFYTALGSAYQAIGDREKSTIFKNKQIEAWQQTKALTVLMDSKKIENDYNLAIADQKIQNLNNEKKLRESRYIIGIICMLSLSVIFLLSSLYFKQRTKSLIKQQELSDLALQNEIIKSNTLQKEKRITSLEFELERKTIKDNLRNKISTDLHDEVGTMLTGLAMQSELLERRSPKESKAKLNQISALSRTAMLGMRDAVWAMDSQKDFTNNLLDRMNEFAHEHLEHTGISFDMQTFGMDKNTPLSGDIRHHFNLIFKEALANVLKHAKASAICVRLSLTEKMVSLDIKDNGTATEKCITASGLGLANMRKRAESLNGNISFSQNKGFGILVEIPV